MAEKATDLVMSYIVHPTGKVENHEGLQKALAEGYRVVDVFLTPMQVGGEGSNIGSVVVTVLLSTDHRGSGYRRN
jgi:hypothetical protein